MQSFLLPDVDATDPVYRKAYSLWTGVIGYSFRINPKVNLKLDLRVSNLFNEDMLLYYATTQRPPDGDISNPQRVATSLCDRQDAVLPHSLADVELAIITAHLGVAENGAVWVTEPLLGSIQNRPLRAIPFIAQHLAVVLSAEDLVPTMHDAYARIGADDYTFGVFIAGPSKTADIEQSLVLGAHGPKTMTVFLLN